MEGLLQPAPLGVFTRRFPRSLNMDISVEVSGADNERMSVLNETVEVVDAVDSLRANVTGAGTSLMAGEQQLIVTHAQDVLVPTSEVRLALFTVTTQLSSTPH